MGSPMLNTVNWHPSQQAKSKKATFGFALTLIAPEMAAGWRG
jgi:hypothetical protein